MRPGRQFLPLIGGVLGLFVITLPFVWLRLDFNYAAGTLSAVWTSQKAARLAGDLWPVVVLVLGMWGLRLLYSKYEKPLTHFSLQAAKWGQPGRQIWVLGGVWFFLVGAVLFLQNNVLSTAIFVCLWMIQALGLNIAIGMTGLLVLGYAGFFSLGGYTFAVVNKFYPWVTWWMALPLAIVAGGTAGWLVGLPCLRLRGDYLAIVTLGFGECFYELVRNCGEVTGGDQGLSVALSAKMQGVGSLSALQVMYLVALLGVFLMIGFCQRLYHSWIGRAWVAIREDEISAAAVGIPVVPMKLLAFVISAALGAVAGVLDVAYSGFIDPAAGTFENSVMVLAMVILGGLGSIPGVLLGSTLLYVIPTLLRDDFPAIADYRLLLFGVIMVVMMRLRPQGLLGSRRHQLELKASS